MIGIHMIYGERLEQDCLGRVLIWKICFKGLKELFNPFLFIYFSMARTLLTDDIWQQIQSTMQFHGCYCSKNSRNIMEAILWKLRTGATWRDIPEEFCPWKTAYNRFNRWASKGLWDKFFLNYEAYWIKNGYSLTEVTYARINMQVELGMVSSEQLDSLEVAEPQKSILQPTRMDYRLILKSLGVKSMTAKLQSS